MNTSVNPEDIIRIAAPLDPILADDTVWDIMIDSYDRVLVTRGDKVEQVASPFASAEELQTLIDDLFGLYGIKLDASNPVTQSLYLVRLFGYEDLSNLSPAGGSPISTGSNRSLALVRHCPVIAICNMPTVPATPI